jgi:hypothetical protein
MHRNAGRLARRAPYAAAIGLALTLVACGGSGGLPGSMRPPATPSASTPPAPPSTRAPTATPTPTPSPTPSLPRGGRLIFPAFRVVAYYGNGAAPGLGILGSGTPDQAAAAVQQQADQYAFAGKPVLPAMELITTVALPEPGPDGVYSSHGDPAMVANYLAAARRHKELLVLDFQPGQGDFLTQVQRFESFLDQPDVGVALDPEWHMKPGQIPGQVIGSASAADINAVSAYLEGLVTRHRLPQKLFVIHQFQAPMLPDRQAIVARPGLATVFHADGNGTPGTKLDVYGSLAFPGPPFYRGFKLFFTRDYPLMSPQQTISQVNPVPDLISYQ